MPTFAEKLGIAIEDSLLLRKAAALGMNAPELLEQAAVSRGCWHYREPQMPVRPNVTEKEFSNEELAIALLSPALRYSPHTIRLGAAMLGDFDNEVSQIVRLAESERCVGPVEYIARAGMRFEPDNTFWRQLLEMLPKAATIPEGVMPHPTRFVSMAGITREGPVSVTVWIRPRPDLALTHG